MIGKAKSISHTVSGVDYSLQEKKESTILKHNYCSGMNGKEVNQEFKTFQHYNEKCKTPTLSIVLSPEPKNGKELSNKQMVNVTNRFMEEMGLSEHQYIAVQHKDKEHKHIHIYANRIDFNGKAYNDSFVGKKASRMADKVAKELGLTRAMEVQKENLKRMNNLGKEFKNEIKDIHKEVVGTRRGRGLTFEQYKGLMKEKGVQIHPTINKQGNLQGFRMEYRGENLKASEVNRDISIKKMDTGHKGEENFMFDTGYLNKYAYQIEKDRKQSFKTIQEQTKTVLKKEKTKQIQTSQPIKKAKKSSEQEIDQHIDRKRENREQSNNNGYDMGGR